MNPVTIAFDGVIYIRRFKARALLFKVNQNGLIIAQAFTIFNQGTSSIIKTRRLRDPFNGACSRLLYTLHLKNVFLLQTFTRYYLS